MRHVDLDEELKQLLGEQARFRSVQKPALEAIMQHKSPVVCIMGTGAGKSVLFMLPASVSSGVTVVVVPLVSLREDMRKRCDSLGISCVEWNSRRPNEWAQVVLVTPESATGMAFAQFIQRQRAMGRLDRIVIDECHVVLDSLTGWRNQMLELRNLITMETQMVYLTATLRPSEEALFMQLMGLPAKERCQWLRGVTTRGNIRYWIHEYNVEEEEEAVQELVEGLKKKYPLPGQIIVYSDTVKKAEALAARLGCVCYHRNIGNIKYKSRLLTQLTSGQQQVFVATNALGLGVDAPTIRAVVHVGVVRQIRQYAQESGRAGRDGLGSEAIIMRGLRKVQGEWVPQGFCKEVDEDMKELIGSSQCMRKVLDQAMDGRRDRYRCEEGEQACQRCRGAEKYREEEESDAETIDEQVAFQLRMNERRRLAAQEVERQRHDAIEVKELVELLERWKYGCHRCQAFGSENRRHGLQECVREGASAIREGIEGFKKMIRWAPYSCCFDCGLPQAICSQWEMNISTGGYRRVPENHCQYAGVLEGIVFSVWVRRVQDFGEAVEAAMRDDGWIERSRQEEKEGPGMEAVCRWFGERKRWGGLEGNKMSWFAVQVVKAIDSRR